MVCLDRRPVAGRVMLAMGCWAVAASGCLALAGCGKDGSSGKPAQPTPEAGYVVAKKQSVAIVTELTGRTSAFESSEVRPQVSGILKARLFTEGAIVHAGQTLYQIDPSLYQASAAQAQANLASAQANSVAAKQRADRYRPLAQIEAVSKQDYADANATAQQANAAVAQNRAQVQTAQINLRFTRVPAPITGRIGRSFFTTGALVTSNQVNPLAVIQRLDPIFVDIQQSSADMLALRRKMTHATKGSADVELVLEDGSVYPLHGQIQFAEAVVDPSTGTVALRARFPNPDGLLLPGMYARARLTQSVVENAVLVPQAGLTRDARGKASVLLVGPDDKATPRDVVADRTQGDAWIVTSGLQGGEKVIVEGLGRIRKDAVVKPVPAGSKPARGKRGSGAGGDTGKARG